MASTSSCSEKEATKAETADSPFPYNLSSLTWDLDHLWNEEGKYCYCGRGLTAEEGVVQCSECKQWFHDGCIVAPHKQIFPGDTHFEFECKICGKGKEKFKPLVRTWTEVSVIALLYLTLKHHKEEKRSFFRAKEVHEIVDKNWDSICEGRSRTTTWENTVSASMSTKVADRFCASHESTSVKGYWGLRHPRDQFPQYARFLPLYANLPGTSNKSPPKATSTPKKEEPKEGGESATSPPSDSKSAAILPPGTKRKREKPADLVQNSSATPKTKKEGGGSSKKRKSGDGKEVKTSGEGSNESAKDDKCAPLEDGKAAGSSASGVGPSATAAAPPPKPAKKRTRTVVIRKGSSKRKSGEGSIPTTVSTYFGTPMFVFEMERKERDAGDSAPHFIGIGKASNGKVTRAKAPAAFFGAPTRILSHAKRKQDAGINPPHRYVFESLFKNGEIYLKGDFVLVSQPEGNSDELLRPLSFENENKENRATSSPPTVCRILELTEMYGTHQKLARVLIFPARTDVTRSNEYMLLQRSKTTTLPPTGLPPMDLTKILPEERTKMIELLQLVSSRISDSHSSFERSVAAPSSSPPPTTNSTTSPQPQEAPVTPPPPPAATNQPTTEDTISISIDLNLSDEDIFMEHSSPKSEPTPPLSVDPKSEVFFSTPRSEEWIPVDRILSHCCLSVIPTAASGESSPAATECGKCSAPTDRKFHLRQSYNLNTRAFGELSDSLLKEFGCKGADCLCSKIAGHRERHALAATDHVNWDLVREMGTLDIFQQDDGLLPPPLSSWASAPACSDTTTPDVAAEKGTAAAVRKTTAPTRSLATPSFRILSQPSNVDESEASEDELPEADMAAAHEMRQQMERQKGRFSFLKKKLEPKKKQPKKKKEIKK